MKPKTRRIVSTITAGCVFAVSTVFGQPKVESEPSNPGSLTDFTQQKTERTRLSLAEIRELGIFNERDSRYFQKLLDPSSGIKHMLIPVDGFYWESTKKVAETLRRVVGPEIIVSYSDLSGSYRSGHHIIGHVTIENIGMEVDIAPEEEISAA